MRPVIGIDVSKESQGFILLEKNKPYGNSFRFQHTHSEMSKLFMKLDEIGKLTGLRPVVQTSSDSIDSRTTRRTSCAQEFVCRDAPREMLEAEMDTQLGYTKHDIKAKDTKYSRYGTGNFRATDQ